MTTVEQRILRETLKYHSQAWISRELQNGKAAFPSVDYLWGNFVITDIRNQYVTNEK